MKKSLRILALLLCAAVLLAMLCSSAFLVLHQHHFCTGDACPVCAQLAVAARVLGSACRVFFTGVVWLHVCACTAAVQHVSGLSLCRRLPTALKVKLSD